VRIARPGSLEKVLRLSLRVEVGTVAVLRVSWRRTSEEHQKKDRQYRDRHERGNAVGRCHPLLM
jgi:hypothetical protein